MTRPLIPTALALLGALSPLSAQAPAPPRAPAGRLAQALDLTPEQQQKLLALRTAHRDALRASRTAARASRQALHQALKDPATSDDQLKALFMAQAEQRFAALLAHRHHRQAVRALLTPEQREKAAELRGRRQGPGDHGHRPGADRR